MPSCHGVENVLHVGEQLLGGLLGPLDLELPVLLGSDVRADGNHAAVVSWRHALENPAPIGQLEFGLAAGAVCAFRRATHRAGLQKPGAHRPRRWAGLLQRFQRHAGDKRGSSSSGNIASCALFVQQHPAGAIEIAEGIVDGR